MCTELTQKDADLHHPVVAQGLVVVDIFNSPLRKRQVSRGVIRAHWSSDLDVHTVCDEEPCFRPVLQRAEAKT